MGSTRSKILLVFFSFAFLGIAVRSFQIQVLPNERLRNKIKSQYSKKFQAPQKRGNILDRNGEELSIASYLPSIFIDPLKTKDPYSLAKHLSSYLNPNFRELYKKITAHKKRGSRFIWIERKVDPEIFKKIDGSRFDSLFSKYEVSRLYPYGQLASHLIGFTGIDGKGLEGLELQYDSTLNPKSESRSVDRDARGRILFAGGDNKLESIGYTLKLTIDRSLQYFCEQTIMAAVQKHKAKSGSAIIMNAETGEILALANVPTYNLSNPSSVTPSFRRNRSITDGFEPGSTFKVFTVAAALEENLLTQDESFSGENGRLQIGNRIVKEAHDSEFLDQMNYVDILAHSSNIGTTKIAFKLGPSLLLKWITNFGFGSKTDIDFPGEVEGILPSDLGKPIVLSNVSFGQGVSVTPIQLVAAYAAIANGGNLVQPRLVKEVLDDEGNKVQEFQPIIKRRVISKTTSELITRALLNVTGPKGTGKNAAIDGYQVAGKTGTSQIPFTQNKHKGYIPGKYIGSFIGFTPGTSKKYIVFVQVDEPEFPYYGSYVAAPTFSEIMRLTLIRNGIRQPTSFIAPLETLEELKNKQSNPPKNWLLSYFRSTGVSQDKKNEQPSQQLEAPLINSQYSKTEIQNGIMPNLSGKTARDVLKILKDIPQEIEILGSGYVIKHSPEPGGSIEKNKKIVFWLSK